MGTPTKSLARLAVIALWVGLATPADAQTPPVTAQRSSPPDLTLKEVEKYKDVAPPAKPLDPVVFAEEVDPYGSERPMTGTGLLRQELYRQAVLVAARDELRLTTRDASLGEMPPDGLAAGNRIRVHVRSEYQQPNRWVRVEAGGEKFRLVWAAESPVGCAESVLDALQAADELSRGGCVTALKRVGGWSADPRKPSAQAVPKGVEPALARPTVVSQLSAVRTLHAAAREGGESPAVLAALSRGYAHLGVLTDRLWDGSTWVFKARSLLYAERLRRLDPAAPDGLWARGYALALAGRHADALADFAAADKAAGKRAPPEWVPLAAALCKFDSAALRKKAADGPLADTALLFLFLTEEDWELPGPTIAVGAEVLARLPECHRVSDSLARVGALGQVRKYSYAGLEAIKTAYREELERAGGLPREVFALVQDNGKLDDLLASLAESGKDAKDRREVSWAVLHRIATESRLTYVESSLSFLRYHLGVPTEEHFAEVKPLIADHPLFPAVNVYGFDADRDPEQAKKLLRQLPSKWYTTRQQGRRMHGYLSPAAERDALHLLSYLHGDFLYTDLALMVRPIQKVNEGLQYAEKMYEVSPHSPIARAWLLLAGTDLARKSAAAWEKECQHPVLSQALAKRALADKDNAAAERHLEKTLSLTKEYKVFRQLADLYLAGGNEEKWLATMQAALEEPAAGLEHAQVRVRIANHYLGKKEYATARKFADKAAETGAGWAMMMASTCAEADGDVKAAEEWIRRTSERYDNEARLWYFWCVRTGRGDVDKAKELLQAHQKRATASGSREQVDWQAQAVLRVAEGNPKEAVRLMEGCFTGENTFFLMTAAILADQAEDAKARDRLLAAVPAKDPSAPLVRLLQDTLKKGEKEVPTKKELDAVREKMPDWAQENADYFIGQFLHQRGEKKGAKEYFERAVTRLPHGAIGPVLSGLTLHAK